MVLKNESRKDPLAGSNISILPCFKLSKHFYANTTSSQKQEKFNTKVITKVEDILNANNESRTILL